MVDLYFVNNTKDDKCHGDFKIFFNVCDFIIISYNIGSDTFAISVVCHNGSEKRERYA